MKPNRCCELINTIYYNNIVPLINLDELLFYTINESGKVSDYYIETCYDKFLLYYYVREK